MIFGGIQKSSTIDFPGILCCVLFTRGCDLNCFYCHNRELIPRGGAALPEEEVWAFLEKRRGLLDGVVVSGGEPTLQADLPEALRRLKAMGYQTKLDTNGQRPGAVAALVEEGLVDYVALDIKATAEDYVQVCGVNGFQQAAKTAKALQWAGIAYELRTTLYPGMTLKTLCDLLAAFPPAPRWRVNYFRPPALFRPQDAPLLRRPALSQPELMADREALLAIQPNLIL